MKTLISYNGLYKMTQESRAITAHVWIIHSHYHNLNARYNYDELFAYMEQELNRLPGLNKIKKLSLDES